MLVLKSIVLYFYILQYNINIYIKKAILSGLFILSLLII